MAESRRASTPSGPRPAASTWVTEGAPKHASTTRSPYKGAAHRPPSVPSVKLNVAPPSHPAPGPPSDQAPPPLTSPKRTSRSVLMASKPAVLLSPSAPPTPHLDDDPPRPPPYMNGYLLKLKGGRRRGWKKKFFAIDPPSPAEASGGGSKRWRTGPRKLLQYYADEEAWRAGRPKRLFSLSDPLHCLLIDRTFFANEPYRHSFSVSTTEGPLHLAAAGEEERLAWLRFLSGYIFHDLPVSPTQSSIDGAHPPHARAVLLPDEFILQCVEGCTMSCTGAGRTLFSHKPAGPRTGRTREPLTAMEGVASVMAGLRCPPTRGQSMESASGSAGEGFIRTSRGHQGNAGGHQEVSCQATDWHAEATLVMREVTASGRAAGETMAVTLFVTNYRLLLLCPPAPLTYRRRQSTSLGNAPSWGRWETFSLDSIHKISLHAEASKGAAASLHDVGAMMKGASSHSGGEPSPIDVAMHGISAVGGEYLQRVKNNAVSMPLVSMRQRMTVLCRDFRALLLGFDYHANPHHLLSVKHLMELLTHKVTVRCHSASFHAPRGGPRPAQSFESKFLFHMEEECARLHLSEDLWRCTSVLSYDQAGIPPAQAGPQSVLFSKPLLIPATISDAQWQAASRTRAGGLALHVVWKSGKKAPPVYLMACLRRGSLPLSVHERGRVDTVLSAAKQPLFTTQQALLQSSHQLRAAATSLASTVQGNDRDGSGSDRRVASPSSPEDGAEERRMASSLSPTPTSLPSSPTPSQESGGSSSQGPSSPHSSMGGGKSSSSPSKMDEMESDLDLIRQVCEQCNPSHVQFINLIGKNVSETNPMQFVEEIGYLKDTPCALSNVVVPERKEVNSAFHTLYEALATADPSNTASTMSVMLQEVEESRWPQLNRALLTTAFEVATLLESGQSVVLQAEAGEYYHQVLLLMLSQLLSDAYYRTLEGFCVLVQKEWGSNVTHPPESDITSWQRILQGKDTFQVPFLQWLECVWQLMELYPRSFEFNHRLLVFLADALNCGTLAFRLGLYFHNAYHLGLHPPTPTKHVPFRDPGIQETSHPLSLPPLAESSPSLGGVLSPAGGSVWALVFHFRYQFVNSLFVKRSGPLRLTGSVPLNCWLPYILRYWNHQRTEQFYHQCSELLVSPGRASTSLNVRGYGLAVVPPLAETLIHLREINLSYNLLTSMPTFLAILPGLVALTLEGNYISSFLEDMMSLPASLRYLNLRYNRLVTLPASLKGLPVLQELYLAGNQIDRLAASSFVDLGQLQVLDLASNRLTELPDVLHHLQALRVLCLQDNQLSELPPTLQALAHLEHLNVADNLLESSGELNHIKAACTGIRKLNISRNPRFDSAFYFYMSQLRELYLRGLHLHQLPRHLRQLVHLQVLDVQDNALQGIPREVLRLTHLTTLNLQSNQLATLPLNLTRLTRLRRLTLRGNPIHTLGLYPLGGLPALEVLDIRDTADILLESVRIANLSHCTALRQLRLGQEHGTTLQDTQLRLFQAQQRTMSQERVPFHYLPHVVLCGPSGTGKSLLAKWIDSRLVDGNLARQPPVHYEFVAPTPGMDLTSRFMEMPGNARGKLFFSLWDLSGAPVYRPIHSLFLPAPGACYLLCFDWRQRHAQQEELHEWLQLIEAGMGVSGSVMLVGTHVDLSPVEYAKAQSSELPAFLESMQQASGLVERVLLVHVGVKALKKSVVQEPLLCVWDRLQRGGLPAEQLRREVVSSRALPLSQLLELELALMDRIRSSTLTMGMIDFYNVVAMETKKRTIPRLTMKELKSIRNLCRAGKRGQATAELAQVLCEAGILYHNQAISQVLGHPSGEQEGGEGALMSTDAPVPCYLDPRWLADLLLTFHPSELASYKVPNTGVIGPSFLEECWRPPLFPRKIFPQLLRLLQALRFLFPLPSPTLQAPETPLPEEDGLTPPAPERENHDAEAEDESERVVSSPRERFLSCQYHRGRGRLGTLGEGQAEIVLPSFLSARLPESLLEEFLPAADKVNSYDLPCSRPGEYFGAFLIAALEVAHWRPLLLWRQGALWEHARESSGLRFALEWVPASPSSLIRVTLFRPPTPSPREGVDSAAASVSSPPRDTEEEDDPRSTLTVAYPAPPVREESERNVEQDTPAAKEDRLRMEAFLLSLVQEVRSLLEATPRPQEQAPSPPPQDTL